ncbi:uncharacterized protein K02A2.6-like [Tachysurus ichikawai]
MEELEGHVSTVVSSLPFSNEILKRIVEETAKDDELQKVAEMPPVAVSPDLEAQLSEQYSEPDSLDPKTHSPILWRSTRVRKPPVRLDL